MMTPLDIAIELSDLFEQTGSEGGTVARLIDAEIMPHLSTLTETNGIDLGKRFAQVIERVRRAVGDPNSDMIRNLKEMMKEVLKTYVKRTSDAATARDVFHHAIMSGAEKMIAVTAGVIVANAMCSHSPQEAQHMVRQIAGKLSGEQVAENASGAACASGAIATVPMGLGRKKKRRKDSIFAEDVTPLNQRTEPVQNPAFDQNADMTNVAKLPQREPQEYQYNAILYIPGEDEEHFSADIPELVNLLYFYRMTKADPTASLWYNPTLSATDVPTLHIYHPSQAPLTHHEISHITSLVQQKAAQQYQPKPVLDHLDWNDLAGTTSIIETLREVVDCGCDRKLDGVMVDPTTAELVVAAHQAMSPKKRVIYRNRSVREMIEIAHRLVAHGLLNVTMEEG